MSHKRSINFAFYTLNCWYSGFLLFLPCAFSPELGGGCFIHSNDFLDHLYDYNYVSLVLAFLLS